MTKAAPLALLRAGGVRQRKPAPAAELLSKGPVAGVGDCGCSRTPILHSIKEVAMATEALLNAGQMAGQTSKLMRREEVAEGTMAFHFAKPSGFKFKAGQ